MKKKKVWLTGLTAVIIIGFSAFLYIQSRSPQPNQPVDPTGSGGLEFQATREDLSQTIDIKGKSSYVNETMIYSPFTANVKEWKVSEGSQVQKGDVLFELDVSEINKQLEQLNLSMQRIQLERKLRDTQSSQETPADTVLGQTEEEARKIFAERENKKIQDRLQAEIEELSSLSEQAQIKENESKLAQAVLASPVDGIFLFTDQKEPKAVPESEPVGKIVDLSQLEMICTVGEHDVFQIQPGMEVEVKVDALRDTRLKGTVEKVSKFAKTNSTGSAAVNSQFEVVVSLEPNEQLIAGLSLTGTIETEKKADALVLPSLAIYKEKGEAYVMVRGAEGAERKTIEIGMETADKTEIISGLNEGDTVILQ